jgi:hypothetical protein
MLPTPHKREQENTIYKPMIMKMINRNEKLFPVRKSSAKSV